MKRKATLDYNLAIFHPDVAKEWHPTKNKSLTPKELTPESNEKIGWQCKRDHGWISFRGADQSLQNSILLTVKAFYVYD